MRVYTPSTLEQRARYKADVESGKQNAREFFENFGLTDVQITEILQLLLSEYQERLNRR